MQTPQSPPAPDPGEELEHLQARLRRWRRRQFLAALVEEGGAALAGALALAGVIVLVVRALGSDTAEPGGPWLWLPFALLVPAGLALALRRAQKRTPDRPAAAAALDLASGGGGLVLLALETSDARWGGRAARTARTADAPAPAEGAVARWSLCALAVAFVLAALMVPVGRGAEPAVPRERLEGFLARLGQDLAALADEGLLDEQAQADWQARLAQIEQRLADAGREASVEALDRLSQDLRRAATLGKEQLAKVAEGLDSRAAELARAALDGAADADLDALAQRAGEALRAATEAAGERAPERLLDAARDLAARLGSDPRVGDLAQLFALSDELRAALEARLSALADQGLLSAPKLERAMGSADAREAFARLAKELREAEAGEPCAACEARAEGDPSGEGGEPGEGEHRCSPCSGGSCSGGVDLALVPVWGSAPARGPGAAPLTFAGESSERASGFSPARLAPVGVDDREQEVARYAVEAELEAVGQAVGSEGVRGGAGDGGGRRRIAPRHRAAIEAFSGAAAGSSKPE